MRGTAGWRKQVSKATTVIEGYVARDAELVFTDSGIARLNVSVPHTPRKFNKDTNEWEDAGETLWTQFTLWREEAQAFAELLTKGTQIRVEGEPSLREWSSGDKSGTNHELKFARVSIIPKVERARRGGNASQTPPAPAGDVWGAGNGSTEDVPW